MRWFDDLAAAAPILGFLPVIEPRPATTTLGPDELLVLDTDLVARRGEWIDDGLERLASSLLGRSASAASVCDDLYGALAEVGPEADDTVLLAVRLA